MTHDDVLAVARDLIAVPSMNPPGDERAVMQLAMGLLEERGIRDPVVVERDPGRTNVVARIRGRSPGPTIALCGHLDTKPTGPRNAWLDDPFAGVVRDGSLHGLGAADMKGAVAAMIVAFGRIARRGGPDRGDALLVLCADEEAGSRSGAEALVDAGVVEADAMVIGEPCGIDHEWESICTACRGVFLFRLIVTSAGGHSSLTDRGGPASAAAVAVRVAARLDQAFRELPGCAVNVPATIDGGTGYGVTAPVCSLRGDVRLAPGIEVPRAEAILRRVVADVSGGGIEIEVVLDELGTKGFESVGVESASPVARACATACARALGRDVPFGVFPGGTDAYAFAGRAHIPTVSALGPGRIREAHHPNERVTVRGLDEAVRVYEALVDAYGQAI